MPSWCICRNFFVFFGQQLTEDENLLKKNAICLMKYFQGGLTFSDIQNINIASLLNLQDTATLLIQEERKSYENASRKR